ncbi:uncharacterized protein LOC144925665 [Branchiostoma floridae x Branchiostoma belcheri]
MAESVSGQEWGRATLKIQDALIVEEQAAESGIGEFYRANKTKTILAICRAVEGNPDVRLGEVEENFPLVPVTFYSQLGYQYFTSILKGHYLQKCLQEELQKIGYEEPIITSGERWELPNLPEGEMQSWELVSMGTRGIIEDRVMSWLDESYHTSGEEGIEGAGPSQAKQARLHQQHWDSPTAKLVKLQKAPMRWLNAGLQQHVDEANVQTWFEAFRCLQKGAAKCLVKAFG